MFLPARVQIHSIYLALNGKEIVQFARVRGLPDFPEDFALKLVHFVVQCAADQQERMTTLNSNRMTNEKFMTLQQHPTPLII
jgi:hypothetical protein